MILKSECKEYERILSVIQKNNQPYRQQLVGARRSIYVGKNIIATTAATGSVSFGNLKFTKFIAFLGQFNKNLYGQFRLNPKLYDNNIQFNGYSKHRNTEKWDQIGIGSFFYNIDLSSAYWQMAHRLGYIATKLFEKFMYEDDYKMAKRLCISFLARKNTMLYYNGFSVSEISCDSQIMNGVYTNIRHELYNIINTAAKIVDSYLDYNTDGITIFGSEINKVKSFFDAEGLIYKVNECRKISGSQYYTNNKIKSFRKAHRSEQQINATLAEGINFLIEPKEYLPKQMKK